MSFPGSPLLIKGGIVLVDPYAGTTLRVISLQYNPESLQRKLEVKSLSDEGSRSAALRLTGPPAETITVEAQLNAADMLESPDENPVTVENGLAADLAALETMVYPSFALELANAVLAQAGIIEIIPIESTLPIFVWGKNRITPVRITDFSITEEAFDTNLNPIRATVSLGLRVLSTADLPSASIGAAIFLAHHAKLESLASQHTDSLQNLGVNQIL